MYYIFENNENRKNRTIRIGYKNKTVKSGYKLVKQKKLLQLLYTVCTNQENVSDVKCISLTWEYDKHTVSKITG